EARGGRRVRRARAIPVAAGGCGVRLGDRPRPPRGGEDGHARRQQPDGQRRARSADERHERRITTEGLTGVNRTRRNGQTFFAIFCCKMRNMPTASRRVVTAAALALAALATGVVSARQLAGRPADDWTARLERPERIAGLKIDYIIASLGLKPGQNV